MQAVTATKPSILYAQPALQPSTLGQNNIPVLQAPSSQPSTNKVDRFPGRGGQFLGLIQLTCGLLCIIFQSFALAVESEMAVVSQGIWGGCFFILTGSVGLEAAGAKTKCLIVTFMVLSIFAAFLAPVIIILSGIGWAHDADDCNHGYWDWNQNEYICTGVDGVVIAMNAVLVFIAIVETVAAILSAIICGRAYCCCARKKSTSKQQFIVVYVGDGPDGNPAVINTQTLQNPPLQQPIPHGLTVVDPNQRACPAEAPSQYYECLEPKDLAMNERS